MAWHINSTQLAGLIAFGLATLVTWLTARRSASARRRAWTWAAAAYGLMFAEVVFGTRHIVSTAVGNLLRVRGVYEERRPFQLAAIVVLLAIIWIAVAWAFAGRQRRGWQLDLSHAAIFIAFNVFLLETISLHAIDHLLYRPIDGVMLVGWVWVAVGAVACLAALAAFGRRGR